MNLKKIFLSLTFLAVVGLAFGMAVPKAQAMTADEIRALIQQLQAQIQQLQQQLAQQEGQTQVWCHNFDRDLKYGMGGSEVRALQTALQKEGFYTQSITGYFDQYTASAVTGFQEKYASEILAPWGLKYGTGFVGRTTRQKLNELYGCNAPPPVPPVPPVPYEKSITVISPNGGEQWQVGKTYTIRWNTQGIDRVYINLMDYSTPSRGRIISSSVSASAGYFNWKIPEEITPGDKYKIAVVEKTENTSGPAVKDESDNYFSIVSSSTTLGYDKCGNGIGWSEPQSAAESCGWPPGSEGYVKDCCCCYLTSHIHDLGTVYDNKRVLVEYRPGFYQGCSDIMSIYSSLDGKNWTKVKEMAVKQETWYPKTTYQTTIDVPGSFRYIKISIPKCYNDYSSAKVVGDIEKSITVISPNGGEQWQVGKTYTIRWNTQGIDRVYINLMDYSTPSRGRIISSSVSASAGYFNWKIPEEITPGDKYKIAVVEKTENTSGPAVQDESDNYFSIISPATTGLKNIQDELASISATISRLIKAIKGIAR